ncbi:MAG: hypothetical protein ACREQ2_25820 [Candidatus Binatia bacterium]
MRNKNANDTKPLFRHPARHRAATVPEIPEGEMMPDETQEKKPTPEELMVRCRI